MSEIKVYGANWCPDCRRVKAVFDEHKIPFEDIDIEAHPEEMETVQKLSGLPYIPVVVFSDGQVVTDPSNEDIIAKIN